MSALTIDAQPSEIRVLASGLELRNDRAVREALDGNKAIREAGRKRASEKLDKAAEIGAEYIRDASTKTRYAPLEDRLRHYHPNE